MQAQSQEHVGDLQRQRTDKNVFVPYVQGRGVPGVYCRYTVRSLQSEALSVR